MRDASIEDMAAFWVARYMEDSNWTSNRQVQLALIREAAKRYVSDNRNSHMWRDIAADLAALLNQIGTSLPQSPDDAAPRAKGDDWIMPSGVFLAQENPEVFNRRYADYWNTNDWKCDFRSALESQFWAYRDYAHGAGMGKMAFLRSFAEVWIAAATTALVKYADVDKRAWRATSAMLRRHASMVEANGLRALPWGPWGNPKDAATAEVDHEDDDADVAVALDNMK
jgi:hypothetical protein